MSSSTNQPPSSSGGSGGGGASSTAPTPIHPRTPTSAGGMGGSLLTGTSPSQQPSHHHNQQTTAGGGGGAQASGSSPYSSPAAGRARANFRASVLTSDVHNEAELIFHILEHREKKCVSKLDMLTLLRGMGMNPTDGDLDKLHISMAPLIDEYEEMVREEERRKERERKKMEDKRGGPKSTNVVKDKAEKQKKIDEAQLKKSVKGGSTRDGSRPGTAATGASTADSAETEEEKKKKLESKLEAPEEVKNIDWHIFMHSVEREFKDARQEEKELMEAFAVFDNDNKNSMTMTELIEMATQNGASVLTPAEVKQLKDAFPDETAKDKLNFRDFSKKLLGTYVPPPPPTAAELEKSKREEMEKSKKEQAEKLGSVDGLLAASGIGTPAAGAADGAAADGGADGQ